MQLSANGISIEVDDQGSPSSPPILLVMGLGMQLTGWPEELVHMLAARGQRVIRLDNRDAGLSQGFDHLGLPSVPLAALRYALRLPVKSAYSIADLASRSVPSREIGLIPMPLDPGNRIFFTPISFWRNAMTFLASGDSAAHSMPA